MSQFFKNVNSLEALKKEYRRLVMLHHPDHGGNTATMQAINAEHDALFDALKAKHNAEHDAEHQTTETPEEFREIIEALLRMDGVEVELCGSWLWIGGNTRAHKDDLKAAGCRWSSSKKLWYWRHSEDAHRWHRGRSTIGEIRTKYGSQYFGTGARAASLEAG